MMGRTHFIAALAGLYALLAGIIALPCLAVWADLEAGERDALAAMLAERAGLIAFLLLIAMAALGIIFDALYRRHRDQQQERDEPGPFGQHRGQRVALAGFQVCPDGKAGQGDD
ncbi:MAG TPA: hypothetical protein VM406_00945, partial [Noviherbaspirillum sp.]|nr:hypothetical protein [Noviherbaspirillum sp.]